MSLASSPLGPPSETNSAVPACDINAPFSLQDKEKRWATLYPLLLERGYRLPPRYRPGWIGSWIRDGVSTDAVDPIKYEDALERTLCPSGRAVDAERVSDGKIVAIKIAFSLAEAEAELPILRYFSQPELVNHPLNHCVPLLDTFRLQMGTEELVIIVEPYVGSPAHPLLILGMECLPYVRQMLEALYFMHMHNTAHRDIFVWNIAMDSSRLFPRGYNPLNDHPKGTILKAFPKSGVDFVETPGSRDRIDLDPDDVKYYFIDFDASIQFASQEERQLVARGARRLNAAPEEGEDGKSPCDPFPIDVYSLGQYFLYVEAFADIDKTTVARLLWLFFWMTLDDPSQRPTAAQALAAYCDLLPHFGWRELLAPVGLERYPELSEFSFWRRTAIRVRRSWDYIRVLFKAVVLGKGRRMMQKELARVSYLHSLGIDSSLLRGTLWEEECGPAKGRGDTLKGLRDV